MKKKLIITILVAIISSSLVLPKEIVEPTITKIYCMIYPDQCPAQEK